jgi:hypothetical protein
MDKFQKIKIAELDQLEIINAQILTSLEKDIKKMGLELKRKEEELLNTLTSDEKQTYVRLYTYSNTSDEFVSSIERDEVHSLYGACKCLDRMINKLKSQHLNCTIKSTLEIAVAKKSLKKD